MFSAQSCASKSGCLISKISNFTDLPVNFSNSALMASVPRHPYFDTIIKTIKQGEKRRFPNKALQVMETTGPFMLTRMYENYPNKDEITLLPAELLSPLCIYEVQNLLRGKMNKVMEKKIERAFAIHYFGGSWHSQTSE